MFLVYALFVNARKKIYKENLFVKILRIILLVLLLPVVIIFIIREGINNKKKHKQNAEKIMIYNISQINSLSGTEFEEYLKLLFEKMGYIASLTKKSKDFGVDLILEKKGRKTIVQAKCYSHTVGVSAVQEIISARSHYSINDAMVVSNQNFSKEAQILAEESGVMLAGRAELETIIQKYPVYFNLQAKKYVATTKEAVAEIEQKYPYWI